MASPRVSVLGAHSSAICGIIVTGTLPESSAPSTVPYTHILPLAPTVSTHVIVPGERRSSTFKTRNEPSSLYE